MAEFGIRATELSAPQGAGSTPIAGVEGGVDAVIDNTIPQGIFNIANQVAVDLSKSIAKSNTNPVLSELTNNLATISQAIDSGSVTSSVGGTRSRAAVTRALAQAQGNPDLVKAINDNAKAFFGVTNLSYTDEARQREVAFETTVINELQGLGMPVVPNPSPELMQQYKQAYMSIKSSEAEFAQRKATFDFMVSQSNFTQSQIDRKVKNDVADFLSSNLPTTTTTLGALAKDLKAKIQQGMQPDEAINTLKSNANFYRQELITMQNLNPEYVNSVKTYLDNYEKMLIDTLDPKVTLESLDAMLKTQKIQDQLLIRTNGNIRAYDAISSISPNNPALQQGMSVELLAAVPSLALSFTGAPSGPNNFNYQSKPFKTELYSTLKESIKSVTAELNKAGVSPNYKGPEYLNNIVNNVLSQAGELSGRTDIKASDTQELVGFLASDEFKMWRKNNELSPEALAGAQDMFSSTYLKAVQIPIINKLNTPLPALGESSSPLIQSIVGREATNIRYIDIFDVQFNGGSIQFVPKKVEGSDLVQMSEARSFMQELNSTKTVINQAIRAGANVAGEDDLQAYWEKNKHNILPIYFPPTSVNLKVGDVVNGKIYTGGSPSSRFSWRDQPNGGTANSE